ncbi:MAG: DUF2510 domain-containing protein [Propionibacteriaceae bacterium]|nr:DUF2510 domain-containing protein [Propionibacteriaceae bacterium]
MSKAGWYPDPGGQHALFRWWDGQQWTPHVTAHPFAGPPQPPGPPGPLGPPPPQGPNQPPGTLPITAGTQPQYGQQQYGQQYGQQQYAQGYVDPGPQRSGAGPIAVLVLVGLLLAGLIVGALVFLSRGGLPGRNEIPPSNPTAPICPPRRSLVEETPGPPHVHPPGRVQGGQLSYPLLGSPWGSIEEEVRVPFGRDVYGQSVMVEPNYEPGANWVASMVVGELVAGDGFFSPEQGAEIVTRCILGVFYGDAELDRTDRVNQATTVDGHNAWLVEMHLTFDIPGLNEKGETALIMIVDTGTASASLFYASIPDSRPELLAQARQVQGQLRVEG